MPDDRRESTPKMPIVLALDLAHRMGWCEGPINGTPVAGSILFGGNGAALSKQLDKFDEWLDERLAAFPVNVLAIEANVAWAMSSKGKSNAGTAKSVWGFVTHAERIAIENHGFRIPPKGDAVHDKSLLFIGPQQAKKHFVGRPTFPVTDDGKRAAKAQAETIGWVIPDLDAADAAAVWDTACALTAPKVYIKGHSAKFTGRIPASFRPSIGRSGKLRPAGPLLRGLEGA